MKALLDNDVLLKGCCYKILAELCSCLYSPDDPIGVLGAARFVVGKGIARKALVGNVQEVQAYFRRFLELTHSLEPSADERSMAADLELAASRSGVSLDGGESQLCAILVYREGPILLTGDKRAIRGIESLIDLEQRLLRTCGRIRCLEQVVLDAVVQGKGKEIRNAICAEPAVDKTLSICFSCTNPNAPLDGSIEGLQSYIDDLRANAGRVLTA